MKKHIIYIFALTLLLTSCATKNLLESYPAFYKDKPTTILLMPPINKSENVEAKEYFHSTLSCPLNEAGFYVIPPFLSMEILKRESAYDAEMFLNEPLNKFGEIFGADLALFTVIDKWEKNALLSTINLKVEYILKSTKTNEVVYTHTADVKYDASVSMSGGGIAGMVAKVALSAVKTAATNYTVVARKCNSLVFMDIPTGKYSPLYGKDGKKIARKQLIKGTLNPKN